VGSQGERGVSRTGGDIECAIGGARLRQLDHAPEQGRIAMTDTGGVRARSRAKLRSYARMYIACGGGIGDRLHGTLCPPAGPRIRDQCISVQYDKLIS
jgi:hypothetical protein